VRHHRGGFSSGSADHQQQLFFYRIKGLHPPSASDNIEDFKTTNNDEQRKWLAMSGGRDLLRFDKRLRGSSECGDKWQRRTQDRRVEKVAATSRPRQLGYSWLPPQAGQDPFVMKV